MAFDQNLADRIRKRFIELSIPAEEKFMMGGVCFMVDEKMCVGVVKQQLMARIDPVAMEDALRRKGCRIMDFTRKPMKGFIFVDPEGTDFDHDLEYFIDLALDFNPRAKSSVKKQR
jgi:hypothetical protein